MNAKHLHDRMVSGGFPYDATMASSFEQIAMGHCKATRGVSWALARRARGRTLVTASPRLTRKIAFSPHDTESAWINSSTATKKIK